MTDLPGTWSILVAAFFGAFFAFLFTQVGQWLAAKLARGRLHRNTLVRLEHACVDYLNDIITNRGLVERARAAAHTAAFRWFSPHEFEVDRSFAIDLIDLDMKHRVVGIMTEMRRYNGDVDHLARAHNDLQQATLAGHITPETWQQTVSAEEHHWAPVETFLGELDGRVRDVLVRAGLLVRQYDTRRAKALRTLGRVRTWPLDEGIVTREREAFDRTWAEQLTQRQQELQRRRQAEAESRERR